MSSWRHGILAGLLVALTSIAWLDPHQAVRDANRLYTEGKYDDAAAGYNAALVDHPDSPDLHFNLGDATYKQGKYEEAVSSFQKVETAADPHRAARVAYNVGNATYRQGQALEQTEPQKALGLYAEALASYRRALGLAPDDEDAKFNHELVTKHIEDLKKKLEEQKKEQDQQKKDEKQDQPPQDQQQKDEQQKDQQKQDDQQQPQDQQEKKDEQQQGGDDQKEPPPQDEQKDQQQQPKPPEDEQQKAEQGGEPNEDSESPEQQEGEPSDEAVAGEHKDGELSKGEAAAILDSQRGEEVSPEDIIKKLQGARVAEPGQDW